MLRSKPANIEEVIKDHFSNQGICRQYLVTVVYSQSATDILCKINNIASFTDLWFPICFHNSPCLTTSKNCGKKWQSWCIQDFFCPLSLRGHQQWLLAQKPRVSKGEKSYLFSHLFFFFFLMRLSQCYAQSVVNNDLSSFFYDRKIYSYFSKINQTIPLLPQANMWKRESNAQVSHGGRPVLHAKTCWNTST